MRKELGTITNTVKKGHNESHRSMSIDTTRLVSVDEKDTASKNNTRPPDKVKPHYYHIMLTGRIYIGR